MNYMPAHDAPPTQPDCPYVRGHYLTFDTKRAGRAVAEHVDQVSYQMAVLPYFSQVVVVGKTCDQAFGGELWGLFTWWDWDAHDRALLDAMEVKAPPIMLKQEHEDDPADAELVQWFADQQLVAEQAVQAGGDAEPDDVEPECELIFAGRRRPRSASWRGGGTMRRR